MSLHTAPTATSDDRRKKRAAVARFVLAGVAVLGIGAAATSAAWTDDAWFSASATSATVELKASLDGATWSDADAAGAAVTIPAATFANMVPGQTRTVTLHLQNTSSVPLALGAPVVTPTGAMFTGVGAATATVATPATPLAAGDTTTVTLTVTTPAAWDASFQGTSGAVTVQFTGTTTA